jgi:hypothetical protein
MAKIVTNVGLAIVAARVKGNGTEPLYIAWGTGAGTAGANDLALFTEASEARVAGVSQITTISVTGDTYQVSGSLAANAAKTITEWGLYDALVGGNLILHETISPGHAVALGQVISFVLKIQFIR